MCKQALSFTCFSQAGCHTEQIVSHFSHLLCLLTMTQLQPVFSYLPSGIARKFLQFSQRFKRLVWSFCRSYAAMYYMQSKCFQPSQSI